jgi:hypothetical protein
MMDSGLQGTPSRAPERGFRHRGSRHCNVLVFLRRIAANTMAPITFPSNVSGIPPCNGVAQAARAATRPLRT